MVPRAQGDLNSAEGDISVISSVQDSVILNSSGMQAKRNESLGDTNLESAKEKVRIAIRKTVSEKSEAQQYRHSSTRMQKPGIRTMFREPSPTGMKDTAGIHRYLGQDFSRCRRSITGSALAQIQYCIQST